MIRIGGDSHKKSHTFVAVDDLGRKLAENTVPATTNGHLDEIGAVPSVGSVADSYDNALAESVNGLYKAELIYGPDQGPWRTVEEVELATLGWAHWWNHQRLHGYLNDIPPAEYEATYNDQQHDQQLAENH